MALGEVSSASCHVRETLVDSGAYQVLAMLMMKVKML